MAVKRTTKPTTTSGSRKSTKATTQEIQYEQEYKKEQNIEKEIKLETTFQPLKDSKKTMSNVKRNTILAGLGLVCILGLAFSASIIEVNQVGYTIAKISAWNGEITFYHNPGPLFQGFATIKTYRQAPVINFGNDENENTDDVGPVSVRFNDNGKANVYGNVSYQLSVDDVMFRELVKKHPSNEHLVANLLQKYTSDVLVATANMFSSEESYSGSRAEFSRLAQDQLEHGKYQTDTIEVSIIDPITNETRRGKKVVIRKDKNDNPLRLENPLDDFGIRVGQLLIDRDFEYEEGILDQIRKQREAMMQAVTSRAEASKASQEALTAKAKGEAAVTTAEYEKLVEKKRAVVEAEKAKEVAEMEAKTRLSVAELDKQSAELTKQKEILIGEGEASRRRAVMEADGALEKKLAAYIEIQKAYAEAIREYRGNWVPVVSSNSAGSAGSGPMDFINLLTVKTAKELFLDITPRITSEEKK